MSTPDSGGPAFPTSHENYCAKYSDSGMTLRDYFAAAALPALVSTADSPNDIKLFAAFAYKIADLMLAERAK